MAGCGLVPNDAITYTETHISIVAFGRERAWKLKRQWRFLRRPVDRGAAAGAVRTRGDAEIAASPRMYTSVSCPSTTNRVERSTMSSRWRAAAGKSTALVGARGVGPRGVRMSRPGRRSGRLVPCDRTVRRCRRGRRHSRRRGEIVGEQHPRARRAHRFDSRRGRRRSGGEPCSRIISPVANRCSPSGSRPVGRGDGHGDLQADDIFCLPDGPRGARSPRVQRQASVRRCAGRRCLSRDGSRAARSCRSGAPLSGPLPAGDERRLAGLTRAPLRCVPRGGAVEGRVPSLGRRRRRGRGFGAAGCSRSRPITWRPDKFGSR